MTQSIPENIVIEKPQNAEDLNSTQNLLPESYLIENHKNPSMNILIAKNQSRTMTLGAIAIEMSDSTRDRSNHTPYEAKTAKIAYVQVKKIWRKLRIGNALMKAAEELCCNEGCSKISMLFDSKNHAAHALTSLKKGWSNGELVYGYTFSSKKSMGQALHDLEKLSRLSFRRCTGVTVQPLMHCDRNQLIDASHDNKIPEWGQLNHHKLELSAVDFSRVVFQDDRVIGWLITYPLGRRTLDYRILWTEQAHRNTGASLSALIEVIRKAHFQEQKNIHNNANDLGFPWPQGFFLVNGENKAMTNFINKRLDSAIPDRSELTFKEKQLSRNADHGGKTH